MDYEPFHGQRVVDVGDVACNPLDLVGAMDAERAASELIESGGKLITLGGDHTIALPLLPAMEKKHGPVAVSTYQSTSTSSIRHM